MRTFLTNIWKRISGIRRDCQGFVVMSTLAIFLFLFILCAFVYAVGETIHQRIKMQNACDAAAYSAAVVQADGLSRMATVNRAMAWSYVQMTNRQMDYITYRWLKLTCKRFDEDLANAQKFNHLSIFAVDKELGWWALLEVAATAVLSELFDLECSGYGPGDDLPSKVGHRDEGHGYWSGLEFGDRRGHNIRLNVNKEKQDNLWEQTKNAAIDGIANMVFTKDNINTILSAFSFIDSNDTPSGWGNRLGKLIDYDKANIRRMNNALARINNQMNVSMKMTAESVLKSMLKDNRIDSDNVLKDYFISIHIPKAANPYETDSKQRSAAGKSFFSPLRNTETDEMLFLNMISPETTNLSLQDHFPKLLVISGAFGLDKWFIRGKANYSDKQEHGYDATPLKDVSFAPRGRYSWTTERDEGALGIQRVYKDSNLNETKAGFFNRHEKTVEKKVWQDTYVGIKDRHAKKRAAYIQTLPSCCPYNDDGKRVWVLAHNHITYEKIFVDNGKTVWRGNHLIDLMNVTNIMTDGIKGFIGAAGGSSADEDYKEEDDDGSIIAGSQSELEDARKKAENERASYLQKKDDAIAQRNALQQERATAAPERQQAIDTEIAGLNTKIASYDSWLSEADKGIADLDKYDPSAGQSQLEDGKNFSSQDQGLMGQIASTLLDGVSAAISNLIGQYLDIQPSCGNNPNLSYTQYPACEHVGGPTTALYSEYRWASCKWFCLTNGFTYAICSVLCHKKIYCDIPKRTIYRKKIGPFTIKIKGRGYGHWGWPKWFCGNEPYCSLIENLPPLYGNITGAKHGYMNSVWDFGNDGFLKPIKPLYDKDEKDRIFSRKDYESCAMFPDGLDLNPALGHYAWPAFIRGHARIYADDKEIFDNRYVGAKCKPWVLNERFFAGDGTILVGAAMKHTNPFVQLFNFWNTKAEGDKNSRTYTTGNETQENAEKTVLSAFNIPEGNFMWTMSAARAGVRRLRRDGKYDQERQYQITYDSTSDPENLNYNSGPYVLQQSKDDDNDSCTAWTSPDAWSNGEHSENPLALSRSVRPEGNILPQVFPMKYRTFVTAMPLSGNSSGSNQNASGSFEQTNVPVYNGCPCGKNHLQFKNMWNLCETDWDATLLPVRYAWQKAVLHLSNGSGSKDLEDLPLNDQNYEKRKTLIQVAYDESKSTGENEKEKNDMHIGNGMNWRWNGVMDNMTFYMLANPFIISGWKKADTTFFEDILSEFVPGVIQTGVSAGLDGLNLNTKVPTGKEEKTVDVISIIKDKVL